MGCPEGQALPKLVQTWGVAGGVARRKVSFLRAASERGTHLLRSPSAPEAAALWPSDEERSAPAHGAARGDGPRQVSRVQAKHKTQTDAVNRLENGQQFLGHTCHTRGGPHPGTEMLCAQQTPPRVERRKGSVAVGVRPADFQRPRALHSGSPTSRDTYCGSL